MQTEDLKHKAMVWAKMAHDHPEFTHDHDVFDNPDAVESLLLVDFIGWKPFKGANALDIGANAGILTAFWALNGANVTAYEADPITYDLLVKMLARTHLQANVINAAVYTYNGTIPFLGAGGCWKAPYRNGAIQVVDGGDHLLDSPLIHCVSLESALGNIVWDCVKIDIEGAEFKALLSVPSEVLRNQVRYMQVEFHNGWADAALYSSLMEKLNPIFTSVGPVNGANPENPSWAGRYHWAQFKRK